MTSRALVVGFGSIGRRHLRLLRCCIPDADIRVLRHSSCRELIAHADGCFLEIEEAKRFAPEVTIISNPAPAHMFTARALAEVGSHLLIEKPISDKSEGVAELIALCSEQNLVCQVGYNLRFHRTLQRFRAEILGGTIGSVHTVHWEVGQYLPGWRESSDYRASVSGSRKLGGGVLLELSHELDALRWVFGEADWLSAWSGRLGKLQIDVEDCAMIQMGFTGGPVAQIGMDFLRRDTTRCCTAIGAHGTLRWDAVNGRVDYFAPESGSWANVTRVMPDRDSSYLLQIKEFLRAVRVKNGIIKTSDQGSHGHVAAQGEDGLAVLRMVEAARCSNEQRGQRILLGDSI